MTMGKVDGIVQGINKVIDNGTPEERFNVVLISEGYRDVEMTVWHQDAQHYIQRLFSTPPFDVMWGAINVYRLDVTSTDSGADDPAECGGTGAVAATYFDTNFCAFGVRGKLRRVLNPNFSLLSSELATFLPNWHRAVMIVNSTTYGGNAGGNLIVSTKAPNRYGIPIEWPDISIHELGHTFGLADEYDWYEGCGIDTGNFVFSGGEPSSPNLAVNVDRNSIKWKVLVLPSTILPTTRNPDCTQCGSQPSPVSPGTVGAFEGGGHFNCGIYRPEFDCMMNKGLWTGAGFCAVCRRAIRNKLSSFLPGWLRHWHQIFRFV